MPAKRRTLTGSVKSAGGARQDRRMAGQRGWNRAGGSSGGLSGKAGKIGESKRM